MEFKTDTARIQKLTGVNFRAWEIQVGRLLKAQGLWNAINGVWFKVLDEQRISHEKDTGCDEDEKGLEYIIIADAKASSLIMQLCASGPFDHILALETAQEQWDKLRSIYAPMGPQQLESKLAAFVNYRPVNGSTITTITTELDVLQSEISTIDSGERPSDTWKISILYRALRTLDAAYDPVILQLGLADITNYEKIVTQLTEYERRLSAAGKPLKENVFYASTQGKGQRGQRGMKPAYGHKGEQKFSGRCFGCNKPGHRKVDCDKLTDDPRGSTGPLATPSGGRGLSPTQSQQSSYYAQEATWMATTETASYQQQAGLTPSWVIDSGCGRHMTYAREAFVSYTLLDRPIAINIANGTSIKAVAEGTVLIKVAVRGRINEVHLLNVLHVPKLAGSLLSVIQLQDRGIMARTTEKGTILLELRGKTIGVAYRVGKMYTLASAPPDTAFRATIEEDSKVWHRRFGHLGASSLATVHSVTTGLPKPIRPLSEECETCIKHKMTRTINRQAPARATTVLQRIHTDAWGPYRVPALNGDTYFFTFTDDFSRKTWVYATDSRAKLRTIFTEFKVRAELETGKKIQKIRCDNISEYKALAQLFGNGYGLDFEFTTTYTPEQNGVAERLNRSLVTAARTMLADAKLPAKFWAEAVKTACYIRNRTPIGPDGKTPHEAYSGMKPRVDHLRAWGCVAYAHLPPINRGRNDKMHAVAKRCCLIGYMPAARQYRLYDPEKKAIIIATAPRFLEDKRLDVNWEDLGEFNPPETQFEIELGSTQDLVDGDASQHHYRSAIVPLAPTEGTLDEAAEDAEDSPEQQLLNEARRPEDQEGAVDDPSVSHHAQSQGRRRTARPQNWEYYPKEGYKDFVPEVLEGRTRRSKTQTQQHHPPEPPRNIPGGWEAENASNASENDDEREASYSANAEEISEPKTYQQAVNDPLHGREWQDAIRAELTTLQSLNTWEYAVLPPGKKPVGHTWVFKVKYTPTGHVDKFKARMVAQGFSQTLGEDFLETFSPTMRGESLRVLLAIAAYHNLEIRQIDVVSAYPRSELHADVYMKPPPAIGCPPGKVLHLLTSLYGLKQSGREWYIEASNGLKSLGLTPIASEPSIFTNNDKTLIIGLYVDDMLLISGNTAVIERHVHGIKRLWDIKDMGEVQKVLGLHILRDRKLRTITIGQASYIDETLEKFGLEKAKPALLPVSDRNTLIAPSPNETPADQSLFQQIIGRLMWIANSTRFDISYATGQLAQHTNAPAMRHWNSALQILRYLSGSKNLKVKLGGVNGPTTISHRQYGHTLHGFCDADYAGDHNDRRSVTGHIYLLNGGPVSWSSSKQKCVATSTTEAEYIALAEASKQGQWLRALLKDLAELQLLDHGQIVPMHSDNQAAIALSQDPTGHKKTKHIDVRYHYIRDLVAYKKATVTYLSSNDMIADILTKPLPATAFMRCIGDLLTA